MGTCECFSKNIKEQVSDQHKPVPLETSNELSKSLCKITINKLSRVGTGFFMLYKSLKCLITNYHIITPDLMYEFIDIEAFNKKISLKLDYNFRYIRLFKQPIDIVIIEIKNSDGLGEEIKFLNYDTNYIIGGFFQYVGLDVIGIGYPFGDKISSASGKIKRINNFEFEHNIPTEEGSSGSPIVLFNTKKVIGIHKNGDLISKLNYGTFISTIFDEVDKDLSQRNINYNDNNNNTEKAATENKNALSINEKKDYESRIAILERKLENNKIQNILTNSPEINIKHSHKQWIKTLVVIEKTYIITGSSDCSIKCIDIRQDIDSDYDDDENESFILFNIEKAHEKGINYIMKVNNNEIISCGEDGVIKRWGIDCYNHYYKLIEIFTFKNTQKAHNKSANKIIMLTNGNLCSCGSDQSVKFWMRNNTYKRYECYQILKCKAEYVQSILELENNKLVAGGWWHTQFFDIKKFQAETDIENTKTHTPNCMIRLGENIICTDDKIYFIDIKSQQLIKTIQIEYIDEEGIYCLYPFQDNLFICGGNLRTIDIYDAKNYEKVASRPVKDEFIFDIKSYEDSFIFCGSESIFAYIFNDLRFKVDNKKKFERDKIKLDIARQILSLPPLY